MGLKTMRRSLAFPPVLTSYKLREIERDQQGPNIWTRIGAAWPNKSGKGSRWRVGKKAFTIPLHTEKDVIAEAGSSPRTLAVGRKWVPGAQGPASLTEAKRTLQCLNGSEQRAS